MRCRRETGTHDILRRVHDGTNAPPQAESRPARYLQAPGGTAERRAASGAMARTGRNAQGKTEGTA
uniref:Uncharacterized protein n=1 Tax=Myoviridae sp. ctTOm1 TaxID=2826657 RepID=A0A8S5N4C4_9CAUD|nr:MAG TPA: hypothetical protein [Myoviridae sp. ctTOm1]